MKNIQTFDEFLNESRGRGKAPEHTVFAKKVHEYVTQPEYHPNASIEDVVIALLCRHYPDEYKPKNKRQKYLLEFLDEIGFELDDILKITQRESDEWSDAIEYA